MYSKYCLRLWEHKDESATAPPWNEILAEELIPTDQSEVEAVIVCVCVCVCVCVWYIVYCAHVHVFCLSHSIMSILIAFFQCNYVLGKTSMRSQNPQYLLQVAWEGILIVFWFNICIHWDMLTTSLVNIHHDTELELFSYNENF